MTVTEMKGNENTVIALPDGWKWVKLEDLLHLNDSGIWGTQDLLDGLLVIRSVNFRNNGSISTENLAKIIPNTVNIQNKRLIGGDILLERSGGGPKQPVGRVALFTLDGKYYFGNFISRLRCKSNVDSNFLFLYLHSIHLNGVTIQLQDQTTGIRNLRFSEYLQLPISLPPTLAEQERIARILNEQMVAVGKAQAAAQARLEAAKALPAAYLRAAFSSEEVKMWPRQRLGDVCEITAKQVDPKIPEFAALPHVNGENIETGTCRITYLKTAGELGMISGKYIFEPGDVLYSKLRPYLRKVSVVEFRGVCSADMYPITVNKEMLNPNFLAWILVSDEFTDYADRESRRARMPKLNRDQLLSWKMPLPPLSVQRDVVYKLSNQLARIQSLVLVIKQELETINAIPIALLRRAFSGGL